MRDGVASVVARVSSRRSSSAVIVVAIGGARENENSRERERKNVSRRKRKVTANADRKKSFLQSPIPDPRNAGGTSRASQRLGGPPMTGVGHVPPLEAGELRRAAGRVEVIDTGLHQRVPGGRAREPQRGVGVLVPSHRATRFRCASGDGKARSGGCVFPLGDGRVEGGARPRSATLRAKAMRFTWCSAADTRVRVAVAVVGDARDVQCESARPRSPLVSCRELSSRVPRRRPRPVPSFPEVTSLETGRRAASPSRSSPRR